MSIELQSTGADREQVTASPLLVLLAAFLGAPVFVLTFNLLVDPLMAVHPPFYDRPVYNTYERYMIPGWIRSFPAETVVLGPSTTQAFQSDLLQKAGLEDAKNISASAATLHEQRLLLEQALSTGKLRRVLWGVEWITVAWPSDQVTDRHGPFPHYLYDRPAELLPDYLMNLDIFRLGVRVLAKRFFDIDSTDVDPSPEAMKIASTGRKYGSQRAIEDYFNVLSSDEVRQALTLPERSNPDAYLENLRTNLIDVVKGHREVRFDIFLPPNSILQLSILEREFPEQWKNFLTLRRELEALTTLPNVRVFDFYRGPFPENLAAYGDIQHFNRDVAMQLLMAIEAGSYQIESRSFGDDDLLSLVDAFRAACPANALHDLADDAETKSSSFSNCRKRVHGSLAE